MSRAALQLRLSQDTHLLSFVEDVLGLKRAVVQSHRLVLQLNNRDANTLFNTAQALCSLAEELDDDIKSEKDEAISLLQEAIELFSLCLSRQEAAYLDTQGFAAVDKISVDLNRDDVGAQVLGDSQMSSTEETAQVLTPIIPEDLIDSALAKLDALEQLAMLYAEDSRDAIKYLTTIANPLLQEKLPYFLSLIRANNQNLPGEEGKARSVTSVNSEIVLAIASWQATFSIAQYRCNIISLRTVLETIDGVFDEMTRVSEQDEGKPEISSVRISRAEALLSLARLLGEQIGDHTATIYDLKAETRLKCLIEAQNIFESHIRSTSEKKARMSIECGDCCLQKSQLKHLQGLPASLPIQLSDQITEARDWYRRAREVSTVSGINRGSDGSISIGVADEIENAVRTEAIVKESVSICLQLNSFETNIPDRGEVNLRLRSIKERRTEQILRDIVDDRLIPGNFKAVKGLLLRLIN